MKWTLLLVGCCLSWALAGAEPVRPVLLGTQYSAGNADGEGERPEVRQVRCIFEQLDAPVHITNMPWRRARLEVEAGRLDGFFMGIPMRGAGLHTALSAPLLLENWYWFWPSSLEAPPDWHGDRAIGTILGSQQAVWLEESGYSIALQVTGLTQLVRLMQAGRIEGVLADKEQFEAALRQLDIPADSFQFRFSRYVPLGVYFNQNSMRRVPDFLERFNQAIPACVPDGFFLPEDERRRIEALVVPVLRQWAVLPELLTTVRDQNSDTVLLDRLEIGRQDAAWQDDVRAKRVPRRDHVLHRPLSRQLRALKAQAQPWANEVIVMDRQGLNVGISDLTSDYWQGDEPKFTEVFGQAADRVFIDQVQYDLSTRKFQVQVSVPLVDALGEALGALTVGVDVEQALSESIR